MKRLYMVEVHDRDEPRSEIFENEFDAIHCLALIAFALGGINARREAYALFSGAARHERWKLRCKLGGLPAPIKMQDNLMGRSISLITLRH